MVTCIFHSAPGLSQSSITTSSLNHWRLKQAPPAQNLSAKPIVPSYEAECGTRRGTRVANQNFPANGCWASEQDLRDVYGMHGTVLYYTVQRSPFRPRTFLSWEEGEGEEEEREEKREGEGSRSRDPFEPFFFSSKSPVSPNFNRNMASMVQSVKLSARHHQRLPMYWCFCQLSSLFLKKKGREGRWTLIGEKPSKRCSYLKKGGRK